MTWDALKASGKGRIVLALEITGYPVIFTTYDWTPTDSWYTGGYYDGVKPWLQHDGVELSDLSRFIEGHFEVGDLTLTVADIAGGMTAQLMDYAARASSRLAAPVSAVDSSITVLDATGWPASGRVWLGQEAVHFSSRTATVLTVDRRGDLGTIARSYSVDYAADPPVAVVVSDGPTDIRGRPCRLHVAVIDPGTGTPGPTTVLFRGFVSQDAVIGSARWQIPIQGIETVLDRLIGHDLPSTGVRTTYSYSGIEGSISTVYYTMTDGYETPFEVTIGGVWSSQESLVRAWNQESRGQTSTVDPYLYRAGDKWGLGVDANAVVHLRVSIREGDPLWALGFEPGMIVQTPNTVLRREAEGEPRLLVVDWTDGYSPRVNVELPDGFSTGLWASLPGHAFARVQALIGSSVVFYPSSQDPVRKEGYWAVESDKSEDMVLSHVVAFSGDPADPDTLPDAMRRALHLLTGQTEPESWLAFGLTSDDIDFTELEDALRGLPLMVRFFYDAVTKGTSPKDLFGTRLGILGIAPRITGEGRIGFSRIATPTQLSVGEISVDDEVWEAMRARDTEARLGGDPLLTQTVIRSGYDYRTDRWPGPTKIRWIDGIAERGHVRAGEYDLRGVAFSERLSHLPDDVYQLEQTLRSLLTATHYGLFGRLAADLVIPCTWLAKQLRVGDQAVLTHPVAPDVVEGRIGIEGRPCIVVGRRRPVTENAPDELTVKVPPRTRASGIGPCALAGLWTPGTLTLTFASADTPKYAAPGGNDLEEFVAGDDEHLWEYDVESPSSGYPLLVTPIAIDPVAKTVTFGVNPFPGGVFPVGGVWMTFPDWQYQSDWQQAWLAIADSSYGLGTTPDEGFTWGI
jgi:hypothetical protein